MEVQSVLFKKRYWTISRARKWLEKHKFISNGKVDTTKTLFRFRQKPPIKEKKYATKRITPSISLVLYV